MGPISRFSHPESLFGLHSQNRCGVHRALIPRFPRGCEGTEFLVCSQLPGRERRLAGRTELS